MKIYFHEDFNKEINFKEIDFSAATKLSTPINKILQGILRNVQKKTGMQFYLDFETLDYGRNWWESNIPIRNAKGDKFLLTWENCD